MIILKVTSCCQKATTSSYYSYFSIFFWYQKSTTCIIYIHFGGVRHIPDKFLYYFLFNYTILRIFIYFCILSKIFISVILFLYSICYVLIYNINNRSLRINIGPFFIIFITTYKIENNISARIFINF